MPLRQRRRASLAITGLTLGLTTLVSAQDKPPAEDLSPEQQLLGDFGSGIRVIGYFAKNDEKSLQTLYCKETAGRVVVFDEEGESKIQHMQAVVQLNMLMTWCIIGALLEQSW